MHTLKLVIGLSLIVGLVVFTFTALVPAFKIKVSVHSNNKL
jgi:hypothetical protein